MSSSEDETSSSGSSSEEEKPKVAAAGSKPATTATSAATTTKKKTTKKSSSSSSSSSSSESSSSDSESEEATKKQTAAAQKQKNKYVHSESESEDEDANKTRMRSAKEKAVDEIGKASRDLRMSLSSDDWPKTKELFEKLNKMLTKHQRALEGGPTPEPYLEAMVALESEIKAVAEDKDLQKKLSQLRYKAWSAIQSKLAKHLQPFRAEMAALPEKKVEDKAEVPPEDEGEVSSTESEASSSSSSSSSSGSSSSGSGSSDESSSSSSSESGSEDESGSESSSDFESDSESSSSSSSDEEGPKLTGRNKWVKRAVLKKARPDKSAINLAQQAAEEKRIRKLQMAELRRLEKIREEKDRKAREAAVVLTVRDVERLILATASKMWKRDANRRELSEQLRGHVSRAVPFGPRVVIPAVMHLISSQFETRNIDDTMSLERWRNAASDLGYVLRLLSKNPTLRLTSLGTDDSFDASGGAATETVEQILSEAARASQGDTQAIQAREKAKAEYESQNPKRNDNPDLVRVVGDLSMFTTRLATELHKALRNTPPHAPDFLERLQDESTLLDLAISVQEYLERIEDFYGASKLALLRVELMYYKHDSIAIPAFAASVRHKVFGNAWHPSAYVVAQGNENAFVDNDPAKCSPVARPVQVAVPELDTAQLMEQLCTFIYKEADDPSRNRAMLCQMYHHALHDRFHKARDLLLMSHLQDNIHNADAELQILFNRVIAQLGLCAFRGGDMVDAHSCLQEICGQGKAKELLAQGIGWRKQHERDMERENMERRRLVPFHMHLDLDLVECCHLTSAMLLEISNLASAEQRSLHGDDRHHQQDDVISRAFRKYLDAYERAVFTGPPENIRDHVMAAAVALREGDWNSASDHVLNLPVWESVPNGVAVKAMLQTKIKGEAIRVYLLTFAAYYESIRMDALCKLFSMDKASVRAVLSKLILSKTLHASLDDEVVRLHKIVPTSLQALALQFADKARDLVDNNERTFDRLTGGGEKRDRDGDGERRHWGGRSRQGDRGDRRQGGGDRGDRRGRGGGGSHLVQRGFRSDRSRSSVAGGQGGGPGNW